MVLYLSYLFYAAKPTIHLAEYCCYVYMVCSGM